MPSSRSPRKALRNLDALASFVGDIFEDVDLHAKRIESLAGALGGTLRAASLSVSAIGRAYAELAEIGPKHGIKQADRFLSNENFDIVRLLPSWLRFVIGERKQIVVALDWTEFDDDDHATICMYLVSSHGRATPLVWKTVYKSTLAGHRAQYEYEMVELVDHALPPEVEITLLADRGFGDQAFYEYLQGAGWDFVIRFRGNILVTHGDETQPARSWLYPTGKARLLAGAQVTGTQCPVAAVVVVHDRRMKEPWCLATSLKGATATEIVKLYGRRFTIEETFRDQKDLRFGMGLRATHIERADRRDRLLLLAALAGALLTLLGAAAESAGLDRLLKANTVKRRTHSLFRQGVYWYGAIPTMRREWLVSLIQAFERLLAEHAVFQEVFGVL